ncbi:N-acetylmuramoyl-L-alanine amidase-like domain-containing protein [Pseudomonas entomophila]|uniref:N-acetylmuramoyl-L-alanine amidase-like domain-containing protein n=1 Tax=Pseudomonas entomophila TaxID=312306 RepID=UPI001F0135B6|nr:N-acetylmuramoyl-L-alanine amidase-like domain-containing protein [Pseudomonas entomophila]MCG8291421.1 DUF1460 domain-containing protein [Pseudomonas entomophila]
MKRVMAIAVFAALQGCVAVRAEPGQATPVVDAYTASRLDGIFNRSRALRVAGESAVPASVVSTPLLGTPYKADTLVGSANTSEQLVVDLRGLDCFTFLDNVEALRRADNYSDYVRELVRTRYAEGKVDFAHRHHFFSDWAQGHGARTRDITPELGAVTQLSVKQLNAGTDGALLIQGLPTVSRVINYLPSASVTQEALSRLQEGDYIGVYSMLPGLDVSHVGVFLRTAQGPVFRNASSRHGNMKVVDYPFNEFLQQVPGIVVLRPI